MKLYENGIPIAGTDLVAVDAISFISGVNFGSVVKVLAAIQLVTEELDTSMDEVVNPTQMPHKPCKFDGTTDRREKETAAFVDLMMKSPINIDLKEYLNLFRRLSSRQAN